MGFDYTIRLVADGQYGYGDQLDDGSWIGLVGDLVNQVCHIQNCCIKIQSIFRELKLQWLH